MLLEREMKGVEVSKWIINDLNKTRKLVISSDSFMKIPHEPLNWFSIQDWSMITRNTPFDRLFSDSLRLTKRDQGKK